MIVLRLYEWKSASKMYGPVEEGECWRIITDKEMKDLLQEKDAVRFIKSL
jgi:hypothetical protein